MTLMPQRWTMFFAMAVLVAVTVAVGTAQESPLELASWLAVFVFFASLMLVGCLVVQLMRALVNVVVETLVATFHWKWLTNAKVFLMLAIVAGVSAELLASRYTYTSKAFFEHQVRPQYPNSVEYRIRWDSWGGPPCNIYPNNRLGRLAEESLGSSCF